MCGVATLTCSGVRGGRPLFRQPVGQSNWLGKFIPRTGRQHDVRRGFAGNTVTRAHVYRIDGVFPILPLPCLNRISHRGSRRDVHIFTRNDRHASSLGHRLISWHEQRATEQPFGHADGGTVDCNAQMRRQAGFPRMESPVAITQDDIRCDLELVECSYDNARFAKCEKARDIRIPNEASNRRSIDHGSIAHSHGSRDRSVLLEADVNPHHGALWIRWNQSAEIVFEAGKLADLLLEGDHLLVRGGLIRYQSLGDGVHVRIAAVRVDRLPRRVATAPVRSPLLAADVRHTPTRSPTR